MIGERPPRQDYATRFTEHMVTARWSRARGWADTEVVAFAEVPLSPAAMVFHYGQAVFEGLKAFRQPDGGVALFRPLDHADRFNRSARRLAMPELPPGVFVAACAALVGEDERAVPRSHGHSLYLRPLMVATEAALGVRPADEYLFAVIASPVSSYFAANDGTISVWVAADARAVPGGTGSAKCAGNYASTLFARQQATASGCQDTLWLDAGEHRWVEELGGMNVAFVFGGEPRATVVTPPVTDTILDGVTRRSVLELARRLGYAAVERSVSLEEMCSAAIAEAFGCGTAAGIAPIGRVRHRSGESVIGNGAAGRVTLELAAALAGVQQGEVDDPLGWRLKVSDSAPGVDRCEDQSVAGPT